MRTFICTGILAAGLLALGSAHAAAQAEQSLVGNWFTEGEEHGMQIQSIIHDKPDGTFSKLVRNISHCETPMDEEERGTWTFDGNVYAEITTEVGGAKVDSSSPEYQDAFEYARVDDQHFTMRDRKTNIVWRVQRVPDDFQIPLDPKCST